MKTIIIFCSLIALTFGEIATSNKYDIHHSQHEQSVNAAKQTLQERLSKLEVQNGYGQSSQYGNSYGSSGSQKYVVGCSTCYGGSENRVSYNSRQSSSSSSQQRSGLENSDYTGVGIVRHSNDARFSADDEENEDVQSVVSPSFNGNSGFSRYSSSNAHEADDMQQRVVPADLSSISSSAYRASQMSEHDEDDLQKTVAHGYKPVYGGSTSSRVYSQSRGGSVSDSHGSSSVVPVYVPGGSQTQSHRSSQSESELTESRKPMPAGQYVSISARPGSSTVLAVPVRISQPQAVSDDNQKYYTRNSGSDYSRNFGSDYSRNSGSDYSNTNSQSQNPTSTTYRVVYNPTTNYVSSDKISSTSESENSRIIGAVQQPEKLTNYNSYAPESSSQTRFRADDSEFNSENNQVRVAPVSVSYPSNGGSSRFASSASSLSQNGQTQTRVLPVFPVNTIESVSSSRTAQERNERRYTPSNPTYLSSSRNAELEDNRSQVSSGSRPAYVVAGRTTSGSDQQSSSQYGTSGSTYYVPSRTQSQHSGSGSQTQYQQQQGGFNYVPNRSQSSNSQSSNSQSSDRLSQRFGSGINTNTDDLQTYMSESERLARLQQQQIAGSSNTAYSNSEANRRTIQTASNLDSTAANFVTSKNLADRNSELDLANSDASGNGGFNRVRSWNKQSKWSSGSEYGPDGKPKSYSTLSTAEAEKFNINGAEDGYKAATTTVNSDGKVSTYSIHT